MRWWGWSGLAVALVLLSGCPGIGDRTLAELTGTGGDEPPTWEGEIQAILADNCIRCHQNPPQRGAPSGFRFDKYDESEGTDGWEGAFERRERILQRAVIAQSMPPGGPPLGETERALIDAWVRAGGPLR